MGGAIVGGVIGGVVGGPVGVFAGLKIGAVAAVAGKGDRPLCPHYMVLNG